MPVTVITRGNSSGDGGFAQRHCLAVICIAIMFKPILMAFAATLVAHHFEVTVPRGLDAVRRVAIGANRALLVAFQEQLTVNALFVNGLDADMAFAAGRRDFDVIDGRIAIHSAFDVVDAVAVVA